MAGELSGKRLPEPTPKDSCDQSFLEAKLGNEEYQVLNDLIIELMKQGVLSNAKCNDMLQKLNRPRRVQSILAHA